MPQPTQVTTEPLDGLRMVANATPPGQSGVPEDFPTGGMGTDHGVPPALPHPPPVWGGLQAAEGGPPLPEDTIFVEEAGILHTRAGDYVTGLVGGAGRLFRYPDTLTTVAVGLRFFDEERRFVFVNSIAALPELTE